MGKKTLDISQGDVESQDKGQSQEVPQHWVLRSRYLLYQWCHSKRSYLLPIISVILIVGYLVNLGFAIQYSFAGAIALVVITPLVIALILYELVKYRYGRQIYRTLAAPLSSFWYKFGTIIKWCGSTLIFIGIIFYLSLVVIQSQRQLHSLGGMVLCLTLTYVTCKHPTKIRWRPVLWGFCLQFVFGVIVLRWRSGYLALEWLAEQVNTFIFYGLDGAAEIFGDPFLLFHPFLMVVIPLVVYLGAVMAVLYYIGLTTYVTEKVGWLMSISLQTTAVESMSLVANIFLSVLDTIFMMRPYLEDLTSSELHCFLVGAHSTIAGFAYGIIIIFGVTPHHLLAAAVMSAPAAIAVAKLNYPETEVSKFKNNKNLKLPKGEETNPIEAFSNGAMIAGKGAALIMIQILALLSLYFFLDNVASYLGSRIGWEVTIKSFLGYVFMPLAYIFGVDWEDAYEVGEILGSKVAVNELFAYYDLGIANSKGLLSPRSNAITTYAVCGFSSFGTLATFSGVWLAVCPNRWNAVLGFIPRVLLNANIACFMTACIAGLFFVEEWEQAEPNYLAKALLSLLELIPSYKDLMALI